MKPGYTDAFWVSILLMVEMILNKNKNKNMYGLGGALNGDSHRQKDRIQRDEKFFWMMAGIR